MDEGVWISEGPLYPLVTGGDCLHTTRTHLQDASKQQKNKDPPTPIAQKPSPSSLQYKLNMRPSAKVKTISLSSPARHKEKNRLFEGLENSPHSTSNTSIGGGGFETFVPRKSVKKLTIKPKPSQVRSGVNYIGAVGVITINYI